MKVAIAGTSGLAQHIAHAAISRGHDVFLLSRIGHPELHPLQICPVDYASPRSLITALSGVDTLISTISNEPQLALVDACLSARVRRFAPSEFQDPPSTRPVMEQPHRDRDRMTVLHRLLEEKHRLESTVFSCGLLYEWFSPGGLHGSGIVRDTGVLRGEGSLLLLDYRNAKAVLPERYNGGVAQVCFTAAEDVGKFVAKALELEEWPAQLNFFGERLTLRELVGMAEAARGKAFDTTELSFEDLHDKMLEAEAVGNIEQAARFDMLMAAQRGEFDFENANLNGCFPEVVTKSLRQWLAQAWRDVDWE